MNLGASATISQRKRCCRRCGNGYKPWKMARCLVVLPPSLQECSLTLLQREDADGESTSVAVPVRKTARTRTNQLQHTWAQLWLSDAFAKLFSGLTMSVRTLYSLVPHDIPNPNFVHEELCPASLGNVRTLKHEVRSRYDHYR